MKKGNRVLSLLLAAVMVVSLLPVSAFAAVDPSTNLCEHHRAHDESCGYVEGAESAPCSYVCQDCAAASATCICDTRCTDTPNADCPVCSGDGAVLAEVCTGQAAEATTYNVKIFTTVLNAGTTTDMGGSISGAGDYAAGATVTLTASPNSGYCAVGWGSNNAAVSAGSQAGMTLTFTMPAEDVEITGSFRPHTLGVFYKDLENGTHDSYCFYCGVAEGNPAAHSDLTDYTGEGEPDGICDACGADMHTHSYARLETTEEYHRYVCECGATPGWAPHNYGEDGQKCTICRYEIAPAKTTYSLTVNYEIYASSGAIIGSGIESKTVEFAPGTVVDLSEYWPEQMTSVGNDGTTYYFRGFSYATDGGGNYYHAVTVSEDTVIYATWVRQNMVIVEFDTNGGEMSYKKAIAGATYRMFNMNSIHMPVRSGYDFVGWSLENDGTADDGDIELTEDCTLYAVWQSGSDEPPASVPVKIGGVEYKVPVSGGTALIVGREDIADGSIREIDMSSIPGGAGIGIAKPFLDPTPLTQKQADELVAQWLEMLKGRVDGAEEKIKQALEKYTLDNLRLLDKTISSPRAHEETTLWMFIKMEMEERENREVTNLVVAPGYVDSTSAFKVTTGQALGVTYSNDAIRDLLASVGTGSNIKVATKFEKAEITKDEARIIVAEWAEIVNTAEGEEQIKNLLTNYSTYELALLQCTNILDLYDSTALKLFELIKEEREKKKEEAGAKDNEEPLAKFSVNTYAVAADGTQTYIPVKNLMQYTIPVDTSGIPENATLALYRVNEDGTRTKQEIISNENGLVIANTDGNSDYILVYELADEHTHSFEWVIDKEAAETEDGIKHEECACGAVQNENTVIPKTGSAEPVQTQPKENPSTGWIIAIIAAAAAVIGGAGYLVLGKKKKD